jgi:hypothetical protein
MTSVELLPQAHFHTQRHSRFLGGLAQRLEFALRFQPGLLKGRATRTCTHVFPCRAAIDAYSTVRSAFALQAEADKLKFFAIHRKIPLLLLPDAQYFQSEPAFLSANDAKRKKSNWR